jgi:alkanesulfonate monooxygenase SsuD/methylene tetrahydromethanopterin reductase-like flavin-dependent oxidoreductase (luciferase family)
MVNLDDPIPIHLAANAPKALAAVGAVGDGWITVGVPPAMIEAMRATVEDAARAADRRLDGPAGRPYTTFLTTGCILRPGEALGAARVVRRVGPVAMVTVHAMWEAARGGHGFGIANREVAAAYGAYLEQYAARRRSPPDRRYLEAHEGHMIYLKPGEEAFLQPELFPALTLTGDAGAVRERVQELAAAGVDNVTVQAIPGRAAELIEEFGREVIGRL